MKAGMKIGGTPGQGKRMLLRSPSPESSPTVGRGYTACWRVFVGFLGGEGTRSLNGLGF